MEYPEGWVQENNTISRVFEFKSFLEALDFVNAVATVAEKEGHHPDIKLFSYNKVKLNLSTHSSGNVTEKDIQLAGKINSIKP